ncbi:hypothetical protein [Paenibacillus amylolyticus]|uniref:hypothetical protein n=1 Tax=Paenibacillus amylolyticus TaxID=1451 RepID=UPI003EBB89FA
MHNRFGIYIHPDREQFVLFIQLLLELHRMFIPLQRAAGYCGEKNCAYDQPSQLSEKKLFSLTMLALANKILNGVFHLNSPRFPKW